MVRPLLFTASLLLLAASPAQGQSIQVSSWGKAGVSYEDYREDALKCGLHGHYQDVSGTDAAKIFKRATSDLQSNEAGLVNESAEQQIGTAITSARIVEGVRPEKRMEEVKAFQLDAVSSCLAGNGYVRFRLTPEEAGRLKQLKPGSEERRQFLHSLASRPNLSDYAVPAGSTG